ANRALIWSFEPAPKARNKVVAVILRRRSILSVKTLDLAVSNSIQLPRVGRSEAVYRPRPVAGSATDEKNTPGERVSWLMTTRSLPLIMKVPLGVIKGKLPK